MGGRQREEIGLDRQHIGVRHIGVGRIGHGGIEPLAVGTDTSVHGCQELSVGIVADARLLVWRDVGGIDGAEWHVEGEAARKGSAAVCRMTGLAVRGMDEIFAVLHDIRTGKLPRNTAHGACLIIAKRYRRTTRKRGWIAAKKQPSRKAKGDDDNDRKEKADNFLHDQAGLAAAFLIARRMRM